MATGTVKQIITFEGQDKASSVAKGVRDSLRGVGEEPLSLLPEEHGSALLHGDESRDAIALLGGEPQVAAAEFLQAWARRAVDHLGEDPLDGVIEFATVGDNRVPIPALEVVRDVGRVRMACLAIGHPDQVLRVREPALVGLREEVMATRLAVHGLALWRVRLSPDARRRAAWPG